MSEPLVLTIELTDDEVVELRRIAYASLPPSDDLRVTEHYDERAAYSVLRKLLNLLPPR